MLRNLRNTERTSKRRNRRNQEISLSLEFLKNDRNSRSPKYASYVTNYHIAGEGEMNILITGGAGMVGSHCAEYFAKRHNRVIVYDNLMRSKIFSSDKKSVEYNWHYLKSLKNVVLLHKDIRDRNSLNAVFKKYRPDIVIHAAAQPGVRFSLDNPYEDFEINCLGTINVLETLRKYSPKATFLFCSTNKVYGDNINKIPLAELSTRYAFKKAALPGLQVDCGIGVNELMNIDLCGHTPYGVSKLAADLYVQDYARTYGIRTGVFRMSCIYGTRQFGFEDQGWVAWFAIRFVQGRLLTIYGDGKQVRDVLWVEDLIAAFDRFIKSGLRHEVFNIGGGPQHTLSLLDLILLLEKITEKKVKIKFEDWRKFDQKVYVSSIAKAERLLKWHPTIAPRQGLEQLVGWIKNNKRLF